MPDLEINIFWEEDGDGNGTWVAEVTDKTNGKFRTVGESKNWDDCAKAVIEFLQQDNIQV